MRNIRKLRYSMLGVLCAGLVLIGIGLGLTFTEFTDLTYAGQRIPETAERNEQTVTLPLSDRNLPVFVEYYSMRDNSFDGVTYTASEDVKPGNISIHMVYRSVGPMLEIGSSSQNNAYSVYWTNWDDMSIFMTLKASVLKDLKEGKLGSYLPAVPEEITVTYHPDDAKRMARAS